MTPDKNYIERLGNDEPILASGTRTPDKRRVSLRWLSGTVMTGITSISLTGVALFVALEGKEQLTLPAVAMAATEIENQFLAPQRPKTYKQARLRASVITDREPDKLVMEVSTLVKEGDQQIVQKRPFAYVSMPLATNFNTTFEYPNFNPLEIFSKTQNATTTTVASSEIYGASIDSEISLRTLSFPLKDTGYPYAASMSLEEAEEAVRSNGSILIGLDSQIAALHYVDFRRFGEPEPTAIIDYTEKATARIVAENISVVSYNDEDTDTKEFFEDVRSIRSTAKLTDVLIDAGYDEAQAGIYADLLKEQIDVDNLKPGASLRVSVEQDEISSQVVRLSVYEQNQHIITAARNDLGRYILADEPEYTPGIAALLEDTPAQLVPVGNLPTVYDAIFKAGLSYGMSQDMIKQLIQMLAANVDFKAQIRPTDTLEAFFSVNSETAQADENAELLYISARFGDRISRFYKFTHPDGTVDFYNEDGRSARQFLLRNPTPTAKFRSGFGMRRHPITGRRRMHSGVDWAAPRGTPILSSGDGVVLEAGWHSGGYGRQTKIRHANGYVSSYSHQSRISKGIVPGARVRQGQVIGTIGSTGLSTGPHLHYELIVNGTKVDPLRVRLPDGKTLAGEALDQFHRERRKLNSLLDIDETTEIASN